MSFINPLHSNETARMDSARAGYGGFNKHVDQAAQQRGFDQMVAATPVDAVVDAAASFPEESGMPELDHQCGNCGNHKPVPNTEQMSWFKFLACPFKPSWEYVSPYCPGCSRWKQ